MSNSYFAFLIDKIDNIITSVCIVYITLPELPPMAVQYCCHVSLSVSRPFKKNFQINKLSDSLNSCGPFSGN